MKKAVKKRTTWTFQPDPDVERMMNEVCASRGDRTRIINEAIRSKNLGATEALIGDEIRDVVRALEKLKSALIGKAGIKG